MCFFVEGEECFPDTEECLTLLEPCLGDGEGDAAARLFRKSSFFCSGVSSAWRDAEARTPVATARSRGLRNAGTGNTGERLTFPRQ